MEEEGADFGSGGGINTGVAVKVLCVKTADSAKAKNIAGRVVTLKLKTRYFETVTRRRTLAQPVQLADTIFNALEPLLDKEANGRKFRCSCAMHNIPKRVLKKISVVWDCALHCLVDLQVGW